MKPTAQKESSNIIDAPVSVLAGVGPRALEKFVKLNIATVRDLLWHFPYRYEDFSARIRIDEIRVGVPVTVIAKLKRHETRPARRRNLVVTEAEFEDESGVLKVIWFNQRFLIDSLKPGVVMALSGAAKIYQKSLALVSPVYEFLRPDDLSQDTLKPALHTGRFVPIYPETEGVTSRWLRHRIDEALGYLSDLEDPLPESLIASEHLMPLAEAVRQMHFPKNAAAAKAAKERLTFDDLFLLQLKVQIEKRRLENAPARALAFKEAATKNFVTKLPFKLTKSQRVAAWQIMKDLARPRPMNRLLEGDVGTGKTLVAAMAALQTALNEQLTLILVPTEILATQHSEEFSKLLGVAKVSVATLTSALSAIDNKPKPRAEVMAAIRSGLVHVVVGTHALLQNSVDLPQAALVVVDEQHRFGVRQRSQLLGQGALQEAHLLSMTATPIPRTLAMTLYGSLDISVLKEFPRGRRDVTTKIVDPKHRDLAYDFIKSQLKAGHQAFVICPLVDNSESIEARAAKLEFERLALDVFSEFKLGLLHGQLSSGEKEAAMHDFRNGATQIMVATSVVEVGIDVPRASVMIIESAERFGLAQLHQLRGRVGRASQRAYCFLFSEQAGKEALGRLKAFAASNDGFDLAEADLRLRGPGEFGGLRQSGIPDLAMRAILEPQMIARAQAAVLELLNDPSSSLVVKKLSRLAFQRFSNVVLA